MAFSPQQLLSILPRDKVTFIIAYSGGMDSHVLLQTLCKLRDSGEIQGTFKAIHVNHGLSRNAAAWAKHCQQICASLDVSFQLSNVEVVNTGEGLESAARSARLAVYKDVIESGEIKGNQYLLTGHHQDDQMETMLFRIMRGTGLRGLSGIVAERPFGNGTILRPLLKFSRSELEAYARQEGLDWIKDESNELVDYDRNYLRHEVLPVLSARWPGYRKNWQRLAQLAAEGELLQNELGKQDLALVQKAPHRLEIASLLQFSPLRQRNILRSWFLALEEEHNVPAPDYQAVSCIFEELIPAAEDGSPLVSWTKNGISVEVRRFASHIYMVLPGLSESREAAGMELSWDTGTPVQLPGKLGTLSVVEVEDEGLLLVPGEQLTIKFKQGGEKIKPAGRKTRSLKKVFQDYRVPPWLRTQIPMIHREDDLLAVADLFICDQHNIKKEKAGSKKLFIIQWQRADLHCGY